MSGSRTWQVCVQHIQIKESMGSDSMPYEPFARLRSAGTTEKNSWLCCPLASRVCCMSDTIMSVFCFGSGCQAMRLLSQAASDAIWP